MTRAIVLSAALVIGLAAQASAGIPGVTFPTLTYPSDTAGPTVSTSNPAPIQPTKGN